MFYVCFQDILSTEQRFLVKSGQHPTSLQGKQESPAPGVTVGQKSMEATMAYIRIAGLILSAWLAFDSLSPTEAATITILTEEVPPFNFVQEGKVTGLSAEVAKEIMRRLKVEYPINVLPWVRAYHTVQSMPDVLIFTLARTSEREGLFRWVGTVFTNEYYFYRRKGTDIEAASLDEAGKVASIGVYRDDVRHQYLAAQGFTNLDMANTDEENYLKLHAGRVTLMVSSPRRLPELAAKTGIPANFLEPVLLLMKTDLCLAFSSQTTDEIFQPWARAFEELKIDGFLERERAKWLK